MMRYHVWLITQIICVCLFAYATVRSYVELRNARELLAQADCCEAFVTCQRTLDLVTGGGHD